MTTVSTTMAMSSWVMPLLVVAEAVEDALPVLKMEEHHDAAHDQQHAEVMSAGIWRGCLPAQCVEALRTEHACRSREQRRTE